MTHSLHRELPPPHDGADFVLLLTPAWDMSDPRLPTAMTELLDVVLAARPANIGSYSAGILREGVHVEQLRKAVIKDGRLRCCFSSRSSLVSVLRELKTRDLGVSVVVSGNSDYLLEAGRAAKLKPHTVNCSCGVHGKYLPDPAHIRSISSQCGHGMVPTGLVLDVLDRLKRGILGLDDAVTLLARPCLCGIFNPDVSRNILKEHLALQRRELET